MTDLLRIQELGQRLVTPVLPGLISEGAMVMTPTGAILIEDLSEGDRVLTYDRGAAVLEGFLHVTVCANGGRDVPIEINPYGKGSVCVSPHSLLLVDTPHCQKIFGSSKALVRAASLSEDRLARGSDQTEWRFIALCLNQPGLIYVNGLIMEALGARDKTSGPDAGHLKMIRNTPSGLLFLSDEEARFLYKHAGGAMKAVKFVDLGTGHAPDVEAE